jgi:hypothetical protein
VLLPVSHHCSLMSHHWSRTWLIGFNYLFSEFSWIKKKTRIEYLQLARLYQTSSLWIAAACGANVVCERCRWRHFYTFIKNVK